MKLRLDWREIHHVNTRLEDLLEQYKKVFTECVETYRGQPATFQVDPSVRPHFTKVRTVPYALRHLVVQQLDTMEKEGVISPVKYAEWTTPIVPVLKSDKELVRIYGDYKRSVNQATEVEQYPLPRIEDRFTVLAGEEIFTKLDLSQAYTQIPLDPWVKKYTVSNTPKGLHEFNNCRSASRQGPRYFKG